MIPPARSVFQLHFRLGNEPICSIPQQQSKFISRCFAAECGTRVPINLITIFHQGERSLLNFSSVCSVFRSESEWKLFHVAFSETFSQSFSPYTHLSRKKFKNGPRDQVRSNKTKYNILVKSD